MKTLFPILLLVLLAACNKPSTQQIAPTEDEQATSLARQLANAQAQALYKCQPFVGGPSAFRTNGHWIWKDRRGLGTSDIEAVVSLAPDLSTQSVQVLLLDSRAQPFLPRETAPTPR